MASLKVFNFVVPIIIQVSHHVRLVAAVSPHCSHIITSCRSHPSVYPCCWWICFVVVVVDATTVVGVFPVATVAVVVDTATVVAVDAATDVVVDAAAVVVDDDYVVVVVVDDATVVVDDATVVVDDATVVVDDATVVVDDDATVVVVDDDDDSVVGTVVVASAAAADLFLPAEYTVCFSEYMYMYSQTCLQESAIGELQVALVDSWPLFGGSETIYLMFTGFNPSFNQTELLPKSECQTGRPCCVDLEDGNQFSFYST